MGKPPAGRQRRVFRREMRKQEERGSNDKRGSAEG